MMTAWDQTGNVRGRFSVTNPDRPNMAGSAPAATTYELDALMEGRTLSGDPSKFRMRPAPLPSMPKPPEWPRTPHAGTTPRAIARFDQDKPRMEM